MKRVIRFVGKEHIKGLLGDREFIGKDWFNWLKDQKIPFYMRVKQDAIVHRKGRGIAAAQLFGSLAIRQVLVLNKPVTVYGCSLNMAAMRLNASEWLIVATDQNPVPWITTDADGKSKPCLLLSNQKGLISKIPI